MGTLTVPDNVFVEVEKVARARGVTVDAQAAELLSKSLAEDIREAELLAEIRAEREAMAKSGVWLTDETINQAKNWGRP